MNHNKGLIKTMIVSNKTMTMAKLSFNSKFNVDQKILLE
jgi:hypothetical protein